MKNAKCVYRNRQNIREERYFKAFCVAMNYY